MSAPAIRRLLCAATALAALALQAEEFSALSPDGQNEIRLSTEPVLSYSVYRKGLQRVAPTPLALKIQGQNLLGGKGLKSQSVNKKSRTGTIPMPFYKKASIDDNGNETCVSFGSWAVRLHARNDGVAYRFETFLPGQIIVETETASIQFPTPDTRLYYGSNWGSWGGDVLQNSWEDIYQDCPVSQIPAEKLVYLPLLAKYADGGVMEVLESDLVDYPGWNLKRTAKSPATLTPFMANFPTAVTNSNWQLTDRPARYVRITSRAPFLAKTDGKRTFPWRTFILADREVDLVSADIVAALAKPCQIADVSWIKPGKVAWDWWNDWNIYGAPANFRPVDFKAGCNTKTYEYYIDFAAKHGVEYVIFDEGWSAALNIWKYDPQVDVPYLVKYANERGVGIILWCAWGQLYYGDDMERAFKKFSEMGVKGFKIDFLDRDDQVAEQFIERVARTAAKYKQILLLHGMHKPVGLSRTWPNLLNYEGVHGLEQAKWEDEKKVDFPRNDLRVFYTRMVAGPMDYTPGAMLNYSRGHFKVDGHKPGSQGTRAHQMALMSLFEAPVQMLCDSPTQYLLNPECFAFMAAVPTVWDEIRPLHGELDRTAVVARRKGDVWYLSGIASWQGATLEVATGFLGSGQWKATIFEDGPNATRDGTDYVKRTATIRAGEKVKLSMAPGGGWTARLEPLR
ncbi:MAG: glycoside hydrolase family 97 catalytic domain-containing protein [Kiritimatiellia bacterium]